MSNKLIVMAVLIVTAVFTSGCIFNHNDNHASVPNSNLPEGFTYMGSHEANVDVGGTSMAATEDVYRTHNGEDIYVQTIKSDNPGGLVTRFKSKYKDANYEPFKEIRFNDHVATQVTDYVTYNGGQEPRYVIIWATKTSFMRVGSSKNVNDVLNMAIATGS